MGVEDFRLLTSVHPYLSMFILPNPPLSQGTAGDDRLSYTQLWRWNCWDHADNREATATRKITPFAVIAWRRVSQRILQATEEPFLGWRKVLTHLWRDFLPHWFSTGDKPARKSERGKLATVFLVQSPGCILYRFGVSTAMPFILEIVIFSTSGVNSGAL